MSVQGGAWYSVKNGDTDRLYAYKTGMLKIVVGSTGSTCDIVLSSDFSFDSQLYTADFKYFYIINSSKILCFQNEIGILINR